MCGRFSLGVDTDRLIHEFGLAEVAEPHQPRYNIAPTQPVPAVVRGPAGLRLGSLRWGLVPARARDTDGPLLINARSETVARKPSFAGAYRQRRCWVLADGFYEWAPAPSGHRAPFHIRPTHGAPFAFAGIWERREEPGQAPLVSCAILTTAAAPAIRHLHDRMPVILTREGRDHWLAPDATPDRLAALLRPYPGELEARRVSTYVNSAAHEGPECLAPSSDEIPTQEPSAE